MDNKEKWKRKGRERSYNREYYNKHKAKWKDYVNKDIKRNWYLKNRERILREKKKDRDNNKELYLKREKENRKGIYQRYIKSKRENDKNYRVKLLLRCRLNNAINRYNETKEFKSDDYGISYEKIIEHLTPFPKDIDNYEIDHIIPLSSFNLTIKGEVIRAFNPLNHQWLTIADNRDKRDIIDFEKYPKQQKTMETLNKTTFEEINNEDI